MQWFSALIPSYPDIQAKAHAELDRVVGRNRLPTVEDEKNLPYIHAIVKVMDRIVLCVLYLELMRFIIGSGTLPQSLLAWYSPCKHTGFHLSRPIHPKRHSHRVKHCTFHSEVVSPQLSYPQYTMHHDPQRHPNPHTFNVSCAPLKGVLNGSHSDTYAQPDRYINDSTLSSESANLANANERDHWMFGVG